MAVEGTPAGVGMAVGVVRELWGYPPEAVVQAVEAPVEAGMAVESSEVGESAAAAMGLAGLVGGQ